MLSSAQKTKRKLKLEAYRLAGETYDHSVSFERLVEIRDRLAEIDREIYGNPACSPLVPRGQ
jgi:hypothetical protein